MMVRQSFTLDGSWLFQIDREEVGTEEAWFATDYVPRGWLPVAVPGSWDTYLPDLFGYAGLGWHRRTFHTDPDWRAQRVVLRFEAANYATTVWLNGEKVGHNEGGFTPFEFEVSDHLDWQGENVLVALVDNWPRMGRVPNSLAGWWNYGGIHRGVSLQITPRTRIADLFVRAEPQRGGNASLAIEITVNNGSQVPVELEAVAEVQLSASNGSVGQELSGPLLLAAGRQIKSELTGAIPDARLWSPSSPTLYGLVVTLREASTGQIVDQATTCFGVRRFELQGHQFLLNGEPITLKGFNRHEEYFGTGRVDPGNVLEADLRQIKDTGANMVRIHYPCEPRLYELTDRLGLLAFAEIPFWGVGNRDESEIGDPQVVGNAKQQIRTMVTELKNHPSVVIWSVGNESASDTDAGRRTIGALIDYARELDASRPITYVTNRRQHCSCLDLVDFVCINQYYALNLDGLSDMLDEVHRLQPDKAILMSEFGHEAIRGLHGVNYGSEEQQAQVFKEQWELFQTKDYMVGALIWCWADYWHQPMGPDFRWMNRVYFSHGVVDLRRRPKLGLTMAAGLFSED